MILAAGLGTRLKPLTDRIPKALVEVGGKPMLERVINKLIFQGFDEIVVNVHHFAPLIKEFISSKEWGIEISISDESDVLLDTGGGIVNAYPLLFKNNDEPVLIHNVDIISNADLSSLVNRDSECSVLLVNDRDSGRKLIFDSEYQLSGWHDLKEDKYRPAKKEGKELAFSGIYVLTKNAIEEMKRIMGGGKYSVMDYFLNPERKEKIIGKEVAELQIIDIGKPATLSQAAGLFK